MKTIRFCYALLLLLLCLCFSYDCSTRPTARSAFSVSDSEARNSLVAPAIEEKSFFPEYRLGIGDVIEVKFFNNERFNETVTVRPDGRITLQKIGDIFVIGMTPSRLDSMMTDAYSDFIREPEITVFVRNFSGYHVYILGEVNLPGIYPIQKNMTVLQSLAAAGGPKNTAKLGSVLILRRTEKERWCASKVDLTRPLDDSDHTNIESNMYVHAQDVIYVPKTAIANVNKFLSQIYEGVLPPLDVYLQALWWRK